MGRTIFLVDMNAFFISCEMARNPELKGKPAAVAGDPRKRSGIILAANYEARRYNIKTTMVLHEAQKLCPNLIIVPPSRGLYERNSREVMKILSRYSPTIQQNSIDEAWLDMTGCGGLFGTPVEAAGSIMKTIQQELDLWCSIGISENKFLAKMASERKKPLGITEIYVRDVAEKIWPLPVREMYGIGKQTEARLLELAIYTIGGLARSEPSVLRKNFGKYGDELMKLANGIDNSPVMENPIYDSKSISRSTTMPFDTRDLEYLKTVLLNLAEDVGYDARKYGNKGKTVSIAMKYEDFTACTRQRTITPTYLTKDIYETGVKLLEENMSKNKSIRLLGIGLSNFVQDESEQLSIFQLLGQEKDDKREEQLEKALDSIREKYGGSKVVRARMLEKKNTQH